MFMCLSSCISFKKQCVGIDAIYDLSCNDLGLFCDDLFIEVKVMDGWLSYALCHVLHAKFKGKFIENCDFLIFFYTFAKNLDDIIPTNI